MLKSFKVLLTGLLLLQLIPFGSKSVYAAGEATKEQYQQLSTGWDWMKNVGNINPNFLQKKFLDIALPGAIMDPNHQRFGAGALFDVGARYFYTVFHNTGNQAEDLRNMISEIIQKLNDNTSEIAVIDIASIVSSDPETARSNLLAYLKEKRDQNSNIFAKNDSDLQNGTVQSLIDSGQRLFIFIGNSYNDKGEIRKAAQDYTFIPDDPYKARTFVNQNMDSRGDFARVPKIEYGSYFENTETIGQAFRQISIKDARMYGFEKLKGMYEGFIGSNQGSAFFSFILSGHDTYENEINVKADPYASVELAKVIIEGKKNQFNTRLGAVAVDYFELSPIPETMIFFNAELSLPQDLPQGVYLYSKENYQGNAIFITHRQAISNNYDLDGFMNHNVSHLMTEQIRSVKFVNYYDNYLVNLFKNTDFTGGGTAVTQSMEKLNGKSNVGYETSSVIISKT